MITSILAGAATIASAYLHAYFTEREQSGRQVRKLDLEIEFRIQEFMVALNAMTDQKVSPWKIKSPYTPDDVRLITRSLVGPPTPHKDLMIWSMYPKDFGDRPLASLIAELGAEVGDEKLLENELVYVSGGKLFAGDNWEGRDFSDVYGVATSVSKHILHSRWRKNGFYYLDCPANSPLC
ncbi:MAG: hypothetical protein U1F54_04640 [Burkholderiales bacterium]